MDFADGELLAGRETGLPGEDELKSEMASKVVIAIFFMPSQTEGRAKCSRAFPGWSSSFSLFR